MNLSKKSYSIIQLLLGLLSIFSVLVVIIPSDIEKNANTDISFYLTIIDIMKGGFLAITFALWIIFLEMRKRSC